MLYSTRAFLILILLLTFLLGAAQCGSQSTEAPAAPASIEAEHDTYDEEQAPTKAEGMALAPRSLGEGEKLRVVATNSLIADLIRQVGGDLIDLNLLIPVGTDPHAFQPTPGDVANVAKAHVLFANGLGLEEFLAELIENAGSEVPVVSLSEGVELRELGEGHGHEHEAGADDHAEPGDVDPHTWTTPANAIIFVHNIEQTLSTLDPAHADTYTAHAEAYEAELVELDQWVQAQVETIPAENRKLVTDHTVFGYYADRYGLEQIGAVVPSFSTAAEPSAQELAALQDVIQAQRVKAIFVGNTISPDLEQRVAEDTGIRLVTLYAESLGPAGSGVETYLDYIRHNTTAIVEALR